MCVPARESQHLASECTVTAICSPAEAFSDTEMNTMFSRDGMGGLLDVGLGDLTDPHSCGLASQFQSEYQVTLDHKLALRHITDFTLACSCDSSLRSRCSITRKARLCGFADALSSASGTRPRPCSLQSQSGPRPSNDPQPCAGNARCRLFFPNFPLDLHPRRTLCFRCGDR